MQGEALQTTSPLSHQASFFRNDAGERGLVLGKRAEQSSAPTVFDYLPLAMMAAWAAASLAIGTRNGEHDT